MIPVYAIIFLSLINLQSEDWQLDKDRRGIRVYSREVKGFEIRQFSVSSTTGARLEDIERLMRDLDNYESWMPDVSSCNLLEMEDENTLIYRMIIDSPYPVKDRELVARMRFSRPDGTTLHISYENLPEYMAESKKLVRIPYFDGFWEFTSSGDSTLIKNQFLSDPGGSVPSWLINSFISRNPYQTVLKLKEQVE